MTKQIYCRVTEEEKFNLIILAKQQDLTLSRYIRKKLGLKVKIKNERKKNETESI